MHNKRLIAARSTAELWQPLRASGIWRAWQRRLSRAGRRVGLCRPSGRAAIRAHLAADRCKGNPPWPMLPKLGFAPFAAPAKGVLDGVLRRRAEIRPGHPQGAGAGRRPGRSGRRRPSASPARAAARSTSSRRPGLTVARLVVVGVGKAAEAQGAGFRQARRRGDGQGAGAAPARRRSSPNCRTAR